MLKSEYLKDQALGGGLAGASKISRELATWSPDLRPADVVINGSKELLDGRSRDRVRNDGFVGSATTLTKDSIVGDQFLLNARPNGAVLGVADGWEEEFQQVVETRFNLLADSDSCWLDAARKKTLTDMVRLAVGSYVTTGEVVATAEWLRSTGRPFYTAINMLSPDRLSNLQDIDDTLNIRRGVVQDRFGAPLAYWFRDAHRYSPYSAAPTYTWTRVDARLPWGRPQVLHIYEQDDPEQSRGVAAMVSVLKEMRMTSKYRDVVLQNAVANAMYAAVVESELPSEVVFGSLGANSGGDSPLDSYMTSLAAYVGEANGVRLDGVKIPHLFPGTKLKFQPASEIGDNKYEASLLRHLAAAFGLSYEEFARDFSNTNYSSARASMAMSFRHMSSKKKKAADGMANFVYSLWLEEEINAGNVPLPPGRTRDDFYRPMHREAYCSAEWIGAAKFQIDETKETEAAIARLRAGLGTYENELGKLGKDWRKVLAQRAREKTLITSLGLENLDLAAAPQQIQVQQPQG
jgi:lambda family phage portal protein